MRCFVTSFLAKKIRQLVGAEVAVMGSEILAQNDQLQFLMGQLLARTQNTGEVGTLRQAEFRVFSQGGEDGIIQYLTKVVPIEHRCFVEIGVENYRESNTRFLLMHDNWEGVIIDASDAHVRFLEQSGLRWRHTIDPITAFVTRENINALLAAQEIPRDIGLLSLDIDGMDYWILQAIKIITPRILVVEYNGRFGCTHPVTVPYNPCFNRTAAHYSNCYYGASLPAFYEYASSHGYAFVGANSAGSNAFFVRSDILPSRLPALSVREGFVEPRSRESRDREGRLTFLSAKDECLLIEDMPVIDVRNQETIALRSVFKAKE